MNGIFRGKFDENTSSFMSLRGSKYIQNIFYMMRNGNVNTLKGRGEGPRLPSATPPATTAQWKKRGCIRIKSVNDLL